MSYDISLDIGTGKGTTSIYNVNITSNTKPMLDKAFLTDNWVHVLNGQVAIDIAEEIFEAINRMRTRPDDYREIETQGWGTYEHVLQFLIALFKQALIHYKCVIVVT